MDHKGLIATQNVPPVSFVRAASSLSAVLAARTKLFRRIDTGPRSLARDIPGYEIRASKNVDLVQRKVSQRKRLQFLLKLSEQIVNALTDVMERKRWDIIPLLFSGKIFSYFSHRPKSLAFLESVPEGSLLDLIVSALEDTVAKKKKGR